MRTSGLLMATVMSGVMLASTTGFAQQQHTVVETEESTIVELAKTLGMNNMDIEDWAAIFILSSVFVVALSFAVSRVIRASRSSSVPDDLYDQLAGLEQRLAMLEDRASADGQPVAGTKPVEFSPPG